MAITRITKYIPILDEVYKKGLTTIDLEGNAGLARESEQANAILIPKITTQGLANYNKSTGFVAGEANLTWETHTFTQDRGRGFTIDNADNIETAGVAFAALGADFITTKVVPETDAYRFATLANKANGKANAVLSSANAVEAIDTAIEILDNKNVPQEGRILYLSAEMYKYIKQSERFNRTITPGQSPNSNFGTFDEMKIVRVPSTRFYDAITLYDGTTNEGGTDQRVGGYVKAATGSPLNFLIVHPSAVLPVIKINEPRIFSPRGENGLPIYQGADAYNYQLRLYHDCFVFDNKVDGVYAHSKKS